MEIYKLVLLYFRKTESILHFVHEAMLITLHIKSSATFTRVFFFITLDNPLTHFN